MATGTVEGERKADASPRPKVRLSPVGFWSYSRHDDEFSRGRLSQLRALLLAELRTQYGRNGVQLFQDVSAIPHGADWERITTGAIDESTFFIPIVTPFYMQSEWCARETKLFEVRERTIFDTYSDLSRDRRRIFPLLWIDVTGIEPIDEAAMAAIRAAQWCDFSNLRHRNLEQDEQVLAKVAAFAKSIVDVLQLRIEAPLTAEEREQSERDAEEARRREEEAARDAERQRALEEAAATAEATRLETQEERQRRERQQSQRLTANRRERHEAALRARADRFAALLRSRKLWWGAGAALLALLAILILPRLFGGVKPRPAIEAVPGSAPAPANETAATVPDAAPDLGGPPLPPEGQWLLGRWCVGGNRANVQTISREGDRLVIAFSGRQQTERIRESSSVSVSTDVATYARRRDAVLVSEPGYSFRLEACR